MAKERSLSDLEFQLLVLTQSPKTGRAIALAYQGAKGEKISYGSLYTTLRRLEERSLVKARHTSDGRERLYETTSSGKTDVIKMREYYLSLAVFPPI